ncbi:MAG: DUF167 family protein [Gammaproteobacteria bacterium]
METNDEISWYQYSGKDILLNLVITPRASKDEIVGIQNGRLKIRITSPPTDGKANAHLVKFLAREFHVPKSSIDVISGQTNRKKRILIRNPGQVSTKISSLMEM